jgi:NNP family nitrate/nitrite transporter-like MFS transporter
MAKESTGSYQMGFATFGVLAVFAFGFLLALRTQWLKWASPEMVGGAHGGSGALVHATE